MTDNFGAQTSQGSDSHKGESIASFGNKNYQKAKPESVTGNTDDNMARDSQACNFMPR